MLSLRKFCEKNVLPRLVLIHPKSVLAHLSDRQICKELENSSDHMPAHSKYLEFCKYLVNLTVKILHIKYVQKSFYRSK